MLVLTRRVGESIKIGDEIELTIAEIRGKSIRLAISAPKDLVILRGELAAKEVPAQPAVPQEPLACRSRRRPQTGICCPETPAIAH